MKIILGSRGLTSPRSALVCVLKDNAVLPSPPSLGRDSHAHIAAFFFLEGHAYLNPAPSSRHLMPRPQLS